MDRKSGPDFRVPPTVRAFDQPINEDNALWGLLLIREARRF